MPLNYWNSLKSRFTIDTVYDLELPTLQDDDAGVKAIVTLDSLPKDIYDCYASLNELLKVEVQNAGLLVFDADRNLKYFGHPGVGLKDGKAQLMIGASSGEEFEAVYVPLEWKDDDYYLGEHKLQFSRFKVGDIENAYLKLEVKRHPIEHLIPMRIAQDQDLDALKSAFDNGTLDNLLNGFSAVYCNATKMFKASFEQEIFPKEGVLLVMGRGKYNSIEYDGSMIESVQFQVLAASHPDLEVAESRKDNPQMYPLSEVGSVSFSKSTRPFSMWDEGLVDESSVIYVHFTECAKKDGKLKVDWTPAHTATKDPRRVPKMRAIAQKVLEANPQLQLGASSSTSLPTVSTVSVQAEVVPKQPKKKVVEPELTEEQKAKQALLQNVSF